MSALLIENVRALEPGRGVVAAAVLVEDGRIRALDPEQPPPDVPRFNGGGRLLTPGLIDLHIHGIETCLFEHDPEQMRDGLNRLARYGVTSCLPTLYRVMQRGALDHLARLTEAMAGSPVAGGLHLEGPFLALPGAGAATVPGDLGLLRELLAAAGGRVRAMSISPDTPGIVPVIEHLVERRIVPFITHTKADVEQTERAIAAGARHATHFYDVFPAPPETEPGVRSAGVVEAVLADPRISVDFIADGVHVHPVAIRAALAAKGWQKVVAITDANIGAGLNEGVYPTTWGYEVRVRRGDAARIHRPGQREDGWLAGSALTMDRAINHLRNWLRPTLAESKIWAMATINPAQVVGLLAKGSLLPGHDADLVLWREANDALHVAATWLAGTCIYRAET